MASVGKEKIHTCKKLIDCARFGDRATSSFATLNVDLGNENLVAGLADGAKNVLRVKSAFKSFKRETNLSVITEDGSYYSFNVKFAKEPLLLSIEMTDFLHDGEAVNRPTL